MAWSLIDSEGPLHCLLGVPFKQFFSIRIISLRSTPNLERSLVTAKCIIFYCSKINFLCILRRANGCGNIRDILYKIEAQLRPLKPLKRPLKFFIKMICTLRLLIHCFAFHVVIKNVYGSAAWEMHICHADARSGRSEK